MQADQAIRVKSGLVTRIRRRTIPATIGLALAVPAALGQASMKAAFVANNGNLEGSVTSYTFNPDGSPSFVQKIIIGERENTSEYEPGCNAYTISIAPSGNYLVTGHAAGNYDFQQLTILEVAPDATTTILGEYFTPDTPLDVEWIDDHRLAALRTEFGGTNEVIVYEFDPNGPSLTEVDRGSAGLYANSVAVHPSREYLYVGESYQNRIYAFEVSAVGELTGIQDVDTGSTYPLGLGVSPDGTKLYAAGGISSGGDKILGYNIAVDGTLHGMAGMPFTTPGDSPKDCTFSSDSTILFVGHGSDATARSFLIDEETGQLTATGYWFDVGIQGELGDLVTLNDFLLITDNFYGDRGLYSFDILPGGNFTMNGSLVDSQGIGPREIAAWSPLCVGDIDGDNDVNLSDLALLLSSYGLCEGDPLYVPEADLAGGDNCVALNDLAALLGSYGLPCP